MAVKLTDLLAKAPPPSGGGRVRAPDPVRLTGEAARAREKLLSDWKGDDKPFKGWISGRPHGFYQRDIEAALAALRAEGWSLEPVKESGGRSDIVHYALTAPASAVAARAQAEILRLKAAPRLPLVAEVRGRPTPEDLRAVTHWSPVAGEVWAFYRQDKDNDREAVRNARRLYGRSDGREVHRAIRMGEAPKGLKRARPEPWFDEVLGVKEWHPVEVSSVMLGGTALVSPFEVLAPFLAGRDNRYGLQSYLVQRAVEWGDGPGRRHPEQVAALPGEVVVTDGNQLGAVYVPECPPEGLTLAVHRDFVNLRPLLSSGQRFGLRGAYNLCGREIRDAGDLVNTHQVLPAYAEYLLLFDRETLRAFTETRPTRGRVAYHPAFQLAGEGSRVRWVDGDSWVPVPVPRASRWGEVIEGPGWDGPRVFVNAEMVYTLFKSFLRHSAKGWTVVASVGKHFTAPVVFWQQDAQGVSRRYHVLMPIRVD